MTKVMTKEERLELIKKVAKKVEMKSKGKAAMSAAKAAKKKPVRKPKADKLLKMADEIVKNEYNENQWTDSSRYAEEYYGDVYRDTTRYDNDWN
jgi:hypothetical protein